MRSGWFKCRIPTAIAPAVAGFETYCYQISPNTCFCPVDGGLPMSRRGIVALVIVASGVSIGVLADTARADDCLAAPSSATPGRHWYYRTDRATKKKCWHLGDPSQVSNQATSELASQTLQTLMAPSSNPVATSKNGLSRLDAETLYAQFLEWKRRTGQ